MRVDGYERDLRISDGAGLLAFGVLCSLRTSSSTFFMPISTASEAACCSSGSSEV